MLILVASVQGIYFIITGIWPLVHMRSFVAVTGPKIDLWLVKTVGLLVLVVGAVIGMAAYREEVSAEVAVLAVGSAASLMAIDVVYSAKRVISKIYLADAVAEAILVAARGVAWARVGS